MGASDLHLKVGNVPFIRVDGELQPTQFDVLTPIDTRRSPRQLMSDHKKREFAALERGRPRVHAARRRAVPGERRSASEGSSGMAIRRVRAEVPTFEELRLPQVMKHLADSPRGSSCDGPDRDGQDHHDRGDDRPHQRDPSRAHRDRRGPHRGGARGRPLDHPAAGDRYRHRFVRQRSPNTSSARTRTSSSSARSATRNRPCPRSRRRRPAIWSSPRLHTIDCLETINRLLDLFPPQQQGSADLVRRCAPWHRVAAACPAGRRERAGSRCEVLLNTGRVFDRLIDPDDTDRSST